VCERGTGTATFHSVGNEEGSFRIPDKELQCCSGEQNDVILFLEPDVRCSSELGRKERMRLVVTPSEAKDSQLPELKLATGDCGGVLHPVLIRSIVCPKLQKTY
jgi:hypothetical protein